eukprot:375315-Pelagomonas_calceolata.AAC.1
MSRDCETKGAMNVLHPGSRFCWQPVDRVGVADTRCRSSNVQSRRKRQPFCLGPEMSRKAQPCCLEGTGRRYWVLRLVRLMRAPRTCQRIKSENGHAEVALACQTLVRDELHLS